MFNYSNDLQQKITNYYENYYQECGLADFKQRAKERLNEEAVEQERMEFLQKALGISFQNQKHFVFGAGTAGLAVVLAKKYNCAVFGIEPSDQEFAIIQQKLKEVGLPSENFKKEFGESLSFSNDQFDFVHCFTVLEHVSDVAKCVEEMIRIAKPNGLIYIDTPNYKVNEERHYKIWYPAFLPKFLGKVYLLLRGKPTKFINSINFLTNKKLDKILAKQSNIVWFRLLRPGQFFKNYPTQEIIIRKLK